METLSDFVQETETEAARRIARRELTGWETVIFQLDDEPESELSTAAFAP
jgi:hypothetical protein